MPKMQIKQKNKMLTVKLTRIHINKKINFTKDRLKNKKTNFNRLLMLTLNPKKALYMSRVQSK